MKKIVLSHQLYKDGMDLLAGKGNVIITHNGNSDDIIPELLDADAYILRIGKIDRKAILAAKNLKVIARPGVGVDNVDVEAATELGIPVVIAPGANSRSVAEHAFMLMMMLAKNTRESDIETRKGNFQIREKYASTELGGKHVGVVGFGNIGRIFIEFCRALNMTVHVYDPFAKRSAVEAAECIWHDTIESVLHASDVISLHVPATPDTHHMINDKSLSLMKKGAILINCSRGELIDEAALAASLASGQLGGAGLDVLHQEPMPAEHPLYQFSNVVITPHLAAQTREATARGVTMAVQGTLTILNGERWDNVVNPEVYLHARWQ